MMENGYGCRVDNGLGWYFQAGPLQDRNGGSLQGLGLTTADITGGFSLQTVMLIVGAGVLLWVMGSSAKGAFDKGAQRTRARLLGAGAKKNVDRTMNDVIQKIDKDDLGYLDGMQALEELAAGG